MTKRHLIVFIALAAFILPILNGCEFLGMIPPVQQSPVSEPQAPEIDSPEPEEPIQPYPSPPPAQTAPPPGRFTLRYDDGSTLNPLLTFNRDNILLASLLYESLFVLDNSFNPVPVLCDSWETEGNVRFTFTIKENIPMNDGTMLTASDVVYSFRQAMTRGRYANRFDSVLRLEVEDELVFRVELNAPNSRFVNLLDFPIIKNGSIDSHIPPGTGLFTFADEGATRLLRFNAHRNVSAMPLSTIYLRTSGDNELTQMFDDGLISLLWDDPGDTFDIRLNRLHETRYYDTTALQFIGFNTASLIFRDPDIRRAISSSIERQYIVDNIMPGQSLPAPLALSPAFPWYDYDWEDNPLDPFQEMYLLFKRAGLEDFDDDSYLEFSDGYGGYVRFSVDFIVNSENAYKVQAAYRIARTLRLAGLDISVRELPWDHFINALESGNFDMYYGEAVLGGDFDLSPLLLPGPLNYGWTANTGYRPLIEDFLAARGASEIRYASQILCERIRQNAPFAPILYKRYAIYTPLGAIQGADPSQSAIFRNFPEWTINLSMLT